MDPLPSASSRTTFAHQDLATSSQRRDAGRPDHRRAEQVPTPVRVVLGDGLARVQPDADADGLTR
jgi:hypothetical protein